MRALESRVRSVTGGNGAIYATRRDPTSSSTRSWATTCRSRSTWSSAGWRAVYVPEARASEKMVPTIEGEFARKRRMMSHGWPIVVRGGMLSPRGYDPLYALMIFSHRVLRYALAVPAPGRARCRASRCSATGGCTSSRSRSRWRCCSRRCSRRVMPARPLLVARYYVLTTASLAAGLWDWLATAPPPAGSRLRAPGDSARSTSCSRLGGAIVSAPFVGRCWRSSIRLESPGHPIYRRRESARTARPFAIYKLRTMVRGAEFTGAGLAIQEGDDRITRVGALLRRYSLDELPNLWNVRPRRDVDRRPATDGPDPGRAVHRAPARAPARQAGDHRLGAGQRARRRCPGPSGSSSTSGTSSIARSRSI